MEPETPQHLCKDCNYAKVAWTIVLNWCGIPHILNVDQRGSIYMYWRICRATFDQPRKEFDGIIFYFWWNIWKERNRRTFQQKARRPEEVASLCKDDISQYILAMQPASAQAQAE